jgi:hypothetical protein
MQSLNILIVCKNSSKYLEYIKSSKYLRKLYTTSDTEQEGAITINFNTFQELCEKCRALQIDIVLVEEEKWILEGIADVMRKNYINCFAPTSYWTNLALYNSFANSLLTKYGINIPPQTLLPQEFPVLVKADGILRKANSLQEIISIKKEIFETSPEIAKTVYLEEFLHNKKHIVTSLFDGNSIYTFPDKNFMPALLEEYSSKLERLLRGEKADFIGFINSYLIEENGILYNTGFSFELLKPNCELDFLYILQLAIYQKLNEIK